MTTKKRKNKQIIRVLILVGIFAGVCGLFFLAWNLFFKTSDPEPVQDSTTTVAVKEKKREEKKTEEKKEETPAPQETPEDQTPVQYDGEDPNNKDVLTGVITHAEKVDDKLVIRVNIDQYLIGGSCILALTKDGETIFNDGVAIIETASTSTCEGFDVPMIEGMDGALIGIQIDINADGKTGTINGEVQL